MNIIVNLNKQLKKELFSETASIMNISTSIVERDFWIVWILNKIFSDNRLNKILILNGGISLSKAFALTNRSSRNIDLILNWNLILQNNKFKSLEYVEQEVIDYIRNDLLILISQDLFPLCSCRITNNGFSINIKYPNIFDDNYGISLEIIPYNTLLPFGYFKISSFVAQKFPQVFEKNNCSVSSIFPKRTFWEKAILLHCEANKPLDSAMPIRCSRHYYDLAMMTQNEVKDNALADLGLLKNIVELKQKFYPRTWAKYEEAIPGTLKLLPPEFRLDSLEKDYKAMQNMIFDKYISFDEIIENLRNLEKEINMKDLQSNNS